MTTPSRGSLVVVGGGIAGLSAAWFAAADGWRVTVLDAAPRIGGKLQTAEVAGVSVDVGAESMLVVRPEGVELLDELGLADERIAPLTTAARIRAGGSTHALPARTVMGVPTDLAALRASGVLSERGVAAVEAEPHREPMAPLTDDVSVGAVVRDRVGDEVADRLVEPLLGGVYAGRADGLSLRATVPALASALAGGGSLIGAATALTGTGTRPPGEQVFTSLRGGMGRLPELLVAANRFDVRTGVTVRGIARTPTGFALDCGAVPAAERIEADAVIVAAPASKAARLLRDVAPRAGAELAGIDSANLAIVSFAFDGVALPEGSGLLVAAGERLATKAVTLTTQKWPVDAGGHTLLRASVGRAGEHQALQFDDADLIELVRRELRPLIGIEAVPVDAVVTRWGGGLPQYAVGHVDRVARIRAAVVEVPQLAVCGAAYDGVGIPACIGSARAAVARVTASHDVRGQWSHG